jgi:hypothetical protein
MESNKSKVTKAIYSEQKITVYQGNPLIEALPDIIDSPEKLAKILNRYPCFNESDLQLPPLYRVQLVRTVENYYKALSIHFTIEQIISRMIRFGYLSRNPYINRYKLNVVKGQKYDIEEASLSTSPEFGLIGISGVGKTSLLKAILSTYPKVILHTNYKGDTTVRYQITWLMVQTPSNGSPKGLCLNLLSQIDGILGHDTYYKIGASKRTAELLEYVSRVVEIHSVGVIVFDELQNLTGLGGKKEEQLLNFFVEISNTVAVPIILVGTLKALPLFNGEFRNARRICGEGCIIWNRISKDDEWKAFVHGLFKYQWTKYHVDLNDDLLELLYDKSQGITDIVVKLFMFAQYRAILTGVEKITKGIIKSIVRDYLKPIEPMIDALRRNDEDKLIEYGDIYLKKEDWSKFENMEKEKALLYGNLQVSSKTLQNKDEYNKASKSIAISSWLIQAGFNIKESEEVANETIRNIGASAEINILNRYAYQLISSKREDTENKVEQKPLGEDIVVNADGLLAIFDEANLKNQSVYVALKRNNYISMLNEFV